MVNRRATGAGFAGGLIVLAGLILFVGVAELLVAFSRARPMPVMAVVVAAICWVVAWSLALRVVLAALDVSIRLTRIIPIYTAVLFANNVTPFGQAGGEPVSALVIAERGKTAYETALAAIAGADTINVIPSTAFALVGLAVVWAAGAGLELWWAAVPILAIALLGPPIAYLAWVGRGHLTNLMTRVVTPVVRTVSGTIPRLKKPGMARIRRRIDGFVGSVETIATDRPALTLALTLSAVGWVAQILALWFALIAVGESVSLAVVALAVPVGAVAGVAPLPGGLGGIEATLVAVVTVLSGAGAAAVTAAVLLHRGAIYWLPTAVGGGVLAALGASGRP